MPADFSRSPFAPPAPTVRNDAILVDERMASVMLGLSIRTLFDLRKSGELAFIRVGTAIRYRRSTLEAWAAARETGGAS